MKKCLQGWSFIGCMAIVLIAQPALAGVPHKSPKQLRELVGQSAGVRFHRAADAAKRGDATRARRLYLKLLQRLRGTKAGASVRRRLAKLDGARFATISIDARLRYSSNGQAKHKRKKIKLVISTAKTVIRKIKTKTSGYVLMIEVKAAPGKGVGVSGWLADARRVRRFQWPARKAELGRRYRYHAALSLGKATAQVVYTISGKSGHKPGKAGAQGSQKIVKKSRFRVVFRKATVKRIVSHLAAMQGLTPEWGAGIDVAQTRRFVLETSSRALLLSVACDKLRLKCQLAGKKLIVSKRKTPAVPTPPRPPAPPRR